MTLAIRVGYEAERSIAFGSITNSYALVGSLFSHPIRIIVLQNNTNAAISFSLDGSTTLITLQAGISIVLDLTANKTNDPAGFSIPINQGIYVRYASGAPTSGSVFASAIYATGIVA